MSRSAYDTLFRWARRTTSSFTELGSVLSVREDSHLDGDALVYRLRHWPELAPAHRTADVYRALSLMSNRPVNRAWFLRHSRIKAKELDLLLDTLLAQGAVEVVDVSAYVARK